MYKETSRNKWGELENRSWELKNEDKIASCYDFVKDKKNKGKHCNLSASLSYPDILRLLKIIPTKLVNTQYHTIFHVPAQKDTLGWIYVVE